METPQIDAKMAKMRKSNPNCFNPDDHLFEDGEEAIRGAVDDEALRDALDEAVRDAIGDDASRNAVGDEAMPDAVDDMSFKDAVDNEAFEDAVDDEAMRDAVVDDQAVVDVVVTAVEDLVDEAVEDNIEARDEDDADRSVDDDAIDESVEVGADDVVVDNFIRVEAFRLVVVVVVVVVILPQDTPILRRQRFVVPTGRIASFSFYCRLPSRDAITIRRFSRDAHALAWRSLM